MFAVLETRISNIIPNTDNDAGQNSLLHVPSQKMSEPNTMTIFFKSFQDISLQLTGQPIVAMSRITPHHLKSKNDICSVVREKKRLQLEGHSIHYWWLSHWMPEEDPAYTHIVLCLNHMQRTQWSCLEKKEVLSFISYIRLLMTYGRSLVSSTGELLLLHSGRLQCRPGAGHIVHAARHWTDTCHTHSSGRMEQDPPH